MKKLLLLVPVFFVMLAFTPCWCEIPKLINYQGMLTDDVGNPLTGSYNLEFLIYDDTTGGDIKWSELQNGVQVENGLFNVVLGSQTALDIAFDESYWLAVKVGTETMPRIRITSVGYAYRAQSADTATVALSASAGGGWIDAGSTVRLQTSADSVGIGTSSPNEKLELSGQNGEAGLRVAWGSQYADLYGEFKQSGDDGLVINSNASGGWADMRLQTAGVTRVFIESGGNVGIGTTVPNSDLDVAGSMALTFTYVNSNHTVQNNQCVIAVDASAGVRHIYLPTAVGITGRFYTVKKIDNSSNAVFVEANGSQTIDGNSYVSLPSRWDFVTVLSDGTNWLVISENR